MSLTLQQVFALNPTTTIGNNDLLYLVQPPYTPGTDAAILGSDLKSLFVLSSAIIDTAHGGTGLVSPAAHSLLITNGVLPFTLLSPNPTSGIPLISQGVGSNPVYGVATVVGGGTGSTSYNPYSVLVAGPTNISPFQSVSGTGAATQVLTSNGPGFLPTWQAPAASGTVNPGLINEIGYYAAAGTTISPISPTQINGTLVTSNTGVPSILAGPGTANHVLMSNAAAAPSWSIPTYPNASATAGKIIISDGTNFISSTSLWPNTVGGAGKIVISDGTNNVYSTPTYPNASVAAGKVIISDGTNYVASTPTYPNTSGTAGKVLISDGTNNIYSTPTFPNASATLNHFIISDGTNWIASAFALLMTGNLTMTGAFNVTFNFTNSTNVTFPTSGTLATTTQIINWNNVTSTPITLVDNNGYIVNNGAALVTFNLPATSPIGQRFLIVGHDTGGWKIAQSNVNQHIHVGNSTSTTGLAGFIASTDGNDCVELICTATDNEFTVRNMMGNITVS